MAASAAGQENDIGLPTSGQGGSLHTIRYRMLHPSGDFTYEVLHTLWGFRFLSCSETRGEIESSIHKVWWQGGSQDT